MTAKAQRCGRADSWLISSGVNRSKLRVDRDFNSKLCLRAATRLRLRVVCTAPAVAWGVFAGSRDGDLGGQGGLSPSNI